MHQPSYRDPLDGTFVLPWVRLHALKDYWGMAAILDETPDVHVTFNMVPSLLDQLEEYVSGRAREAELQLGLKPAEELDETEKVFLLRSSFMAHPENLIGRFPRFAELHALRGPRNDEASLRAVVARFGPAEMRDLQVLAKLAWFDLEWQRDDPDAAPPDREGPRLHRRGQAEPGRARAGPPGRHRPDLSPRRGRRAPGAVRRRRTTTRSCPSSATRTPTWRRIPAPTCRADTAIPRTPPTRSSARSRVTRPSSDVLRLGMWPSEGGVSEEAVTEIARAGLRWTASDEGHPRAERCSVRCTATAGARPTRSTSCTGPGCAAPPPATSR